MKDYRVISICDKWDAGGAFNRLASELIRCGWEPASKLSVSVVEDRICITQAFSLEAEAEMLAKLIS